MYLECGGLVVLGRVQYGKGPLRVEGSECYQWTEKLIIILFFRI